MSTIKRAIADFVSRKFKIHMIKHGQVGIHLERDYLIRLFSEAEIDCVFDIGANEGQYAELIRALGYRGPIISFEPIPECAALLRKKAEKVENWLVEELALDATEQDTFFNIMNETQFSSIKKPVDPEVNADVGGNKISRRIPVRTATLDNIFTKYQQSIGFQRPFLKMDTQGNDNEVVRGGETCISNFVGLQSELAIKFIYEGQKDYRDQIQYYESLGFSLTALFPNNAGHFPWLLETDCIMINPKKYFHK